MFTNTRARDDNKITCSTRFCFETRHMQNTKYKGAPRSSWKKICRGRAQGVKMLEPTRRKHGERKERLTNGGRTGYRAHRVRCRKQHGPREERNGQGERKTGKQGTSATAFEAKKLPQQSTLTVICTYPCNICAIHRYDT